MNDLLHFVSLNVQGLRENKRLRLNQWLVHQKSDKAFCKKHVCTVIMELFNIFRKTVKLLYIITIYMQVK